MAPKSEKLILQAELRRAWGVVEVVAGVVAACLGMIDFLRGSLAQKIKEVDDLKKKTASLERKLAVHEIWNHSSRKAVLFAKERKKFQRMADGGDSGAYPDPKKRGHQPGVPGVSHCLKPTKTITCRARMCKNCGATHTRPGKAFWKIVVDLPRDGTTVCHVEETVPAYCMRKYA